MAQNWTLIWNSNWTFSELYLYIYIYIYVVEIKNQIYDSSLSLVKSGRGLKGGQGGPVPSAKEKKKEKK